jgi:hypothetical protein
MVSKARVRDEKTYDWMLDVLSDLRLFSKANGFERLASELEDVSLTAAAEISARAGAVPGRQSNRLT